jgi:dipeptidyl-peptidase-4
MRYVLFLLYFLPLVSWSQTKKLTLEDIYQKKIFKAETVSGFDTEEENKLFLPADIRNEKGEQIKAGTFEVSADKKTVLALANTEKIYRWSSKSDAYLFDVASKKTIPLNKGKVLHATFSPAGDKLAYVFENNLYIYDLATAKTTAVTTDGKWNYIINGNCDWVYEEEFSFTRAYEWSPRGTYIAYYKFDESRVKEYNMTLYNNGYNVDYRYKYPKAGEENSKVEIHIYDVASAKDVKANYEQGDIYIPRIKWTQADDKLVVFWMNRHQDHLKLLLTDATSGTAQPMYEEKNKYYLEINDDWRFLKDGKNFLFTSEMNGYNQVHLRSIDGTKKLLLSKLNHDVSEINGVDEKNRLVYYTVAYPTPMERQLFVSDFDGKNTKQLTAGSGWHSIEMNEDFTQFYDKHSTVTTPQVVSLYKTVRSKKGVNAIKEKTTTENSNLKNLMAQYALGVPEFIKIPNSKGDSLNAWILRPHNFDASKKYPVLFYNYGGPGSQYVKNQFGAVNFWHQFMAQNGFIVISVDNTGTGYRGEEFRKKTYLQLGKLEIEDQIDAARYIGNWPYVDKNRIGHYGWSYGGFMSALAITKGADVFKAAVAGAPVTSWRFYDNIYTERYMRKPQENLKGYDENAPLNHVGLIKGKFLIIHGTGDDNVHFQNSVQMADAMIQKGIQFDSFYYPNQNHLIPNGSNNYHLWTMITEWLVKNLRDDPSPVGQSTAQK